MNEDSRRFLHLVGKDLPDRNPLHEPPQTARDVPPPVRRIMLAGRGLEAAYAAKCEEHEQAQRAAEAANAAYCELSEKNAQAAARIAHLERELAERPRLLTARALRWLRLGKWLGQV